MVFKRRRLARAVAADERDNAAGLALDSEMPCSAAIAPYPQRFLISSMSVSVVAAARQSAAKIFYFQAAQTPNPKLWLCCSFHFGFHSSPRYAAMTFGHLRGPRPAAFGDFHAVIQHRNALANAHDQLHVMFDEQMEI
jgi:hypothetical protein